MSKNQSVKAIAAALRKHSSKAAAEAKFKYDDDFKKIFKRTGDNFSLDAKQGKVTVKIVEQEEFGDLQNEIPNIEVNLGGKKMLLTWNEAYNLADMLNQTVAVAYYG